MSNKVSQTSNPAVKSSEEHISSLHECVTLCVTVGPC